MNAISVSTKESPFLRSLCLVIESPVFLTELFPHLDCTATVHTHQLGSNLSFLPSCLVLRNLQKFSIFETVSSL